MTESILIGGPASGARAAPAASAAPGEWIVDARTDGLFLWQGLALALALWALAASGTQGFAFVLAFYAIYDSCHLMATLPITAFDRTTRRQSRLWLWGGLAGYLAISAGCFYAGGTLSQLWNSAFLYWGSFHVIRQHSGFLRLYQRRAGGFTKASANRQIWLLYVGCITPGLLAIYLRTALYQQLQQLQGLKWFDVPPALAYSALAVFLTLALWVARDAFRRLRAGGSMGRLTLVYLALAMGSYWIADFFVAHISMYMVVIFVSTFHNLQYVSLVGLAARNRHRIEPAATGIFSSWFQGGLWRYLLFALLLGAVLWVVKPGYSPFSDQLARYSTDNLLIAYLGAVFVGIQNLHYFWDGFAWKLSTDARMRRDLGLAGRAPPPSSAPAVPELLLST